MYHGNPISLSSVLLSYLKTIWDFTACTEFIVYVIVVVVFVAAAIKLNVVVILVYFICQETIRRQWALRVCQRLCWSNWSVKSACSTCYHPSRYVATDTSAAAANRKFRNVQPEEKHFQMHGIRHWKKLATRVECSCPNELFGCTQNFPNTLIREHEDVYQFGPFDCPLNYRIKCNWTWPLIEIKGHVLHQHKEMLRHT